MIMVIYFYFIGFILTVISLDNNKLFSKRSNMPGEQRGSWFKILFDILVAWYIAANATLVTKILYHGLSDMNLFNPNTYGGNIVFDKGLLLWVMLITILIDAFVIPVIIYNRICTRED